MKKFKEKYQELKDFIEDKRDDLSIKGMIKYFIMEDYPTLFIEKVGETPRSLADKLFKAEEKYSQYSSIYPKTAERLRILQLAYNGKDYELLLKNLQEQSLNKGKEDFLSDLRYPKTNRYPRKNIRLTNYLS